MKAILCAIVLMASFSIASAACECNGMTDRRGQGGDTCNSKWWGKTWCYTEPHACNDGRGSRQIRGKEWSVEACMSPCQVNNGGCDANAACSEAHGKAHCDCKDGYEGDGKHCAKAGIKGYDLKEGTHCGGTAIKTWDDGTNSRYGQKYDGASACSKICSEHNECDGFLYRPSHQQCSWMKQPYKMHTGHRYRAYDSYIRPYPCGHNNGGCSAHATCTRGEHDGVDCVCNIGYEGDGKHCKEKPKVCECSGEKDNRGQGGPECTSIWARKKYCYTLEGMCSDGKRSTRLRGREWSFMACQGPCERDNGGCDKHASCSTDSNGVVCHCNDGYEGDGKTCKEEPKVCECNGQTDRKGEGGSDCTSLWHRKKWCYVKKGACSDGKASRQIHGIDWSYTACDTHKPSAKVCTADTPGWNNNFGLTCATYERKGWCKDGAFKKGLEWVGSVHEGKGSGCRRYITADKPNCGAVYNYPAQNCCACGEGPGSGGAVVAVPQWNYCTCWGDPHCIMFDGKTYDYHAEGDRVLIQHGDYKVIETQFILTAPWGRVAVNTDMYITIKGVKVLETTTWNRPHNILDTSKVKVIRSNGRGESAFPRRKIPPGRFDYVILFPGNPDLKVYTRGYYWKRRGSYDLGVAYNGDWKEDTIGLCTNGPDYVEKPVLPPTCTMLETCCEGYIQNDNLYDGCLVDSAFDCCKHGATATCCGFMHVPCGADNPCGEDETCDAKTKMCVKTPKAEDCVGEWGHYSSCDETCGMGEKTRTYHITKNKKNGGEDCPAGNREKQVKPCKIAECPPSPWNYCSCWGDPHCIMFGKTKHYDIHTPGDHAVLNHGDYHIMETQSQIGSPWGTVATNTAMYVTVGGKKIVETSDVRSTIRNWKVNVLDESLVKVEKWRNRGEMKWPRRIFPGAWNYILTFPENLHVKVYLRAYMWQRIGHFDVGVAYAGDYMKDTTGLCSTGPEAPQPPVVPSTCKMLETCCHNYIQDDSLYDGCLVDSASLCCAGDADDNCCGYMHEKCNDKTNPCSEDEKCDAKTGMCILVPKENDCLGHWGEYSTCDAGCGVGEKTRTFKVQREASGNGSPCPAHTETRPCKIRECCHNDWNYCSCWGDPHCIMFNGKKFNTYVKGDKTVIQHGAYKVVETQTQVHHGKYGLVATNTAIHVMIGGKKVLETTTWRGKLNVLDASLVTVIKGRRDCNAKWPTCITPGFWDYTVVFPDNLDLKVYIRGYWWVNRGNFDVGVAFAGDYMKDTTGLCTNGPNYPEIPWVPPTCTMLETCCDRYKQNDALFNGCLVDASMACCAGDADGNCCADMVPGCDDDNEDRKCNEGEKCDAHTKLCVPVPEPEDCLGSWSCYSQCNAECGVGEKTRTYTLTREASRGGKECPATNHFEETQPCKLKEEAECEPIIYHKFDGQNCGIGGDCGNDHEASTKPISGVSRDDVAQCEAACNKDESCSGFVWKTNTCFFRSDMMCNRVDDPTADCHAKPDLCIYQPTVGHGTKTCDAKFQIGEVHKHVETPSDCEEKCKADDTCKYMFHDNDKNCMLYNKCDEYRTADTAGVTYTTNMDECVVDRPICIFDGTELREMTCDEDFQIGDAHENVETAQDCEAKCQGDSECEYFFHGDNKKCILFNDCSKLERADSHGSTYTHVEKECAEEEEKVYCTSYADPHVIQFKSTKGDGRPANDFDSFKGGDWLTFSYKGLEVWENHVEFEAEWGPVASIRSMWVNINGERVAEKMTPGGSTKVLKSSAAKVHKISSNSPQFWPTRIRPAKFTRMLTFPGYPDVEVLLRGRSRLGGMIHIGITFTGDVGQVGGFCTERPKHADETAPITCPMLNTCCDKFAASPAAYDECLTDGFFDCCTGEGTIGATCCETVIEAKCTDEGFNCSEGECCDEKTGQCNTCIDPKDCEGYWGAYDACSVDCGEGTKQRTFSVLKKKEEGGMGCDFEDGQTETTTCMVPCGDPCDVNNGGCHELATCESDDADTITCTCNDGLVGDGMQSCQTEDQCLGAEDNMYVVKKEDAYIGGYICGHSTPGDWRYGKCDATEKRYRICNSISSRTDACEKHDPPIRSVHDCAAEVEKLVAQGVCHPFGEFYGTFCTPGKRTQCACQTAHGKTGDYRDSTGGNHVLQLKSGVANENSDPCDIDNGGCHADATCKEVNHEAVCTCKNGMVGDGKKVCESTQECLKGMSNDYSVAYENKYISGDRCGHQTPGDWKYGECGETSARYMICNSWSTLPEKNLCAKHDPPILSQDDCAREVGKLIGAGVCNKDGYFFNKMCHDDGPQKPMCACHTQGGAKGKFYNSKSGYDILQMNSAKQGVIEEQCKNHIKTDADHQCFFSGSHTYSTVACGKYLYGDYCGHKVPGDNRYGKCDGSHARYRICNTLTSGRNDCAKNDPPILTTEDCAREVAKLIDAGVCHSNGLFYSNFCAGTTNKPTCQCQTADGPAAKFYTSSVGNSIHKVKSTVAVAVGDLMLEKGISEEEAEAVGNMMEGTNFNNLALAAGVCTAAFGVGYYYSSYKNKYSYKPLLDDKTIELS